MRHFVTLTLMLGTLAAVGACSDASFTGGDALGLTNQQTPAPSGPSNPSPMPSSPMLDTAEGPLNCVTEGEEFQIDDWEPYMNAPNGYLLGKGDATKLKTYKDTGEENVVLAAGPSLSVGATFAGRSYALKRYELYNDTGVMSHFGRGWAVEVSMDGNNWTTVEQRVPGRLGRQTYVFQKPITSTHLRLRLTEFPYGKGWDVWWLRLWGQRMTCK